MRAGTRAALDRIERNKVGQPTKLTPEVADAIVLGVKTGVPLHVAAQAQGISKMTFLEWMQRGEGRHPTRPQTPLYAEFAYRVRKAEAEIHMLTVSTIRNAAVQRGNWEASRAWLKMRWPEDYAERTEVSGPGGGAVPIQVASIVLEMDDADVQRLGRTLREITAEDDEETA